MKTCFSHKLKTKYIFFEVRTFSPTIVFSLSQLSQWYMNKPLCKNHQITDSNTTVKFGVCQKHKRPLNICFVTEIYRQIDNMYLNKLLNVHFSTVWKKTGYGSKIAQPLNSPVHARTLLCLQCHISTSILHYMKVSPIIKHGLSYQMQKIPL